MPFSHGVALLQHAVVILTELYHKRIKFGTFLSLALNVRVPGRSDRCDKNVEMKETEQKTFSKMTLIQQCGGSEMDQFLYDSQGSSPGVLAE